MKLKWKGDRRVIAAGHRVSPGEVAEFPDAIARQLLADPGWVRYYETTKEKRTRSAGGDR